MYDHEDVDEFIETIKKAAAEHGIEFIEHDLVIDKLAERTKPADDWVWMPHPAHFILADRCQFKMATYLPSGIIVSTIGELWSDRDVRKIFAQSRDEYWYAQQILKNGLKGDAFDKEYLARFGYDDIGFNRKYESMVFVGKPSDSETCCPYVISSGHSYDFMPYNNSLDAYNGHMNLCYKWASKSVKELIENES